MLGGEPRATFRGTKLIPQLYAIDRAAIFHHLCTGFNSQHRSMKQVAIPTSHRPGMPMNKRSNLRLENIESDGPLWKMLEGILFVQMRLHALVEAALAVHHLGLAHHRAMWFIAKRSGITVGELTTILRVSSQALTKTLGQLIERGFVKQTSDARDRRVRRLYLTKKGEPIFLETLGQLFECMEHAARVCGENAVRDFLAVTDVLMDDHNQALVKPRPVNATRGLLATGSGARSSRRSRQHEAEN